MEYSGTPFFMSVCHESKTEQACIIRNEWWNDSSVAAIILQDAGYEVTGITFRFYEKDAHTEYLDDAAELCTRLHIPHLVYDAREIFQQRIITYFINEYLKGRTPCLHSLQQSSEMAALTTSCRRTRHLSIATGHYVQKILHNGRWHISAGF